MVRLTLQLEENLNKSTYIALGLAAVVSFPAIAAADIITGETATASSNIPGFDRGQARAVDDSGLTPGGVGDGSAFTPDQTHSSSPDGTMWLSTGSGFGGIDENPYYLVDLGAVYDVAAVRIFNYNEAALVTRGVNAARVFVSETAPPTTSATGGLPITIPIATGTNSYTGTLYDVSILTGAPTIRARYFLLDIDSNHGSSEGFYGLSELQFDGTIVPEPSALALLGLGGMLALRRRR